MICICNASSFSPSKAIRSILVEHRWHSDKTTCQVNPDAVERAPRVVAGMTSWARVTHGHKGIVELTLRQDNKAIVNGSESRGADSFSGLVWCSGGLYCRGPSLSLSLYKPSVSQGLCCALCVNDERLCIFTFCHSDPHSVAFILKSSTSKFILNTFLMVKYIDVFKGTLNQSCIMSTPKKKEEKHMLACHVFSLADRHAGYSILCSWVHSSNTSRKGNCPSAQCNINIAFIGLYGV